MAKSSLLDSFIPYFSPAFTGAINGTGLREGIGEIPLGPRASRPPRTARRGSWGRRDACGPGMFFPKYTLNPVPLIAPVKAGEK